MFTSVKVRLYPNQAQRQQLSKEFGCSRFVYNRFLAEWNEAYQTTGKGLSYSKCCTHLTQLKKDLPWLKEVASQPLQQSLKCLDTAFKNFFKGHARHPKFKSKLGKQSICYPQGFYVGCRSIKLPKLGQVKAKVHRKMTGKVKAVYVSLTPSGQYFASLRIELNQNEPEVNLEGKIVGVDLGLNDLIVMSDGDKVKPHKYYRKYEKKLAYKQKQLSRKVKGSNNRRKTRLKVAKVHNKIVNCRLDSHHKLSRKLIDENQVIVFEKLNVKGMTRNHKLAKSITDAAWGMLQTLTEYKAKREGKIVVYVDRFFPSTKLCNHCGHRIEKISLDMRNWTCPNCGSCHDRDINAAKNLREVFKFIAVGATVLACGEEVRPDLDLFQKWLFSMKQEAHAIDVNLGAG